MKMRYPFLSISIMLVVLPAGCTEEVASPVGVEEPFAMYGILNPRLSTQTIMVSPTDRLLVDYPGSIDAVLTSTDLESGETITWKDSVVTGERGQIDHVFWADFRPPFDRDYRVEAVRSDGAATSAVAHVPDFVEATAEADAEGNLDILIAGEGFHLLRIDLVYQMRLYGLHERWLPDPCDHRPFSHTVAYDGEESEAANGIRFRVAFLADLQRIDQRYNPHPGRYGLALMGMTVELLVADKAWDPPGGERDVFDENTLADPGVMTNTTNGFGLVAGGYNHQRAVFPPRDVVVRTPFLDGIVRPPADCLNYCGCGEE